MILMLTDVLLEGTQLLYVGDDDTMTQAFGVQFRDHTAFLPGVVSRKKQIIPMLTAPWAGSPKTPKKRAPAEVQPLALLFYCCSWQLPQAAKSPAPPSLPNYKGWGAESSPRTPGSTWF